MQDPRAEKSWHFDPLIERKAALSGDIAPYQIIEATSKDKEKVVGFYQHCPVPGYDIGNVQVIYNRDFNQGFEIQIKKLQQRDNNPAFAPKWGNANNPVHRAKTNERLKEMAKPYLDPNYPAVKILPLWHGTRPEILDSIFRAGYAILRRRIQCILAKDFILLMKRAIPIVCMQRVLYIKLGRRLLAIQLLMEI